jgi:hypothetical protein
MFGICLKNPCAIIYPMDLMVAVCTGATVEYGPYLMAGDTAGAGRGAPSSMTLNLSFIETMQLSRQRYAHEVGAKATGRQSRAEEGTKLGALARFTDDDIQELAVSSGAGAENKQPPSDP